jgi:hypothetical protein
LQEVIRLVFQKFRELGSDRQVLLWMASQNIHFPYPSDGRTLTSFEWRPIRYRNIISILKNPFLLASTHMGRARKRTTIIDGRARKRSGLVEIGAHAIVLCLRKSGSHSPVALQNPGRAQKAFRFGDAALHITCNMTCGDAGTTGRLRAYRANNSEGGESSSCHSSAMPARRFPPSCAEYLARHEPAVKVT